MTQNTSSAVIDGIVIVRFDENGEIGYHVIGDTTRLFIVDERCSHDRVYEWLSRSEPGEIREIIPAGTEIGNKHDDRHDAIAHLIESYRRGERHLRAVDDDGDAA